MFRIPSKCFTRLQTPHKKTHPFPLSLAAGEMKELTALSRRQFGRMDERGAFAHVSPVFLRARVPGGANRLTALRLSQMHPVLSIEAIGSFSQRTRARSPLKPSGFTSDF